MSAPPGNYETLRSRWRDDLELLHIDVTGLFHHRQIWSGMREALVDKDPTFFLDHYAEMYVASQTLRVRRLADPKADGSTRSLARLVSAIAANEAALDRAWFIEQHIVNVENDSRTMWSELADETYTHRFVMHPTDETPTGAAELGRSLSQVSEKVSAFADRYVAHLDSRGVAQLPTFDDLDTAIDVIGSVVTDLELLLNQKSLSLSLIHISEPTRPY